MYPQGMIYACQDNAWMDERVMLMWVEMVLKPYVDTAPENVVPLLFLDSYCCHMTEFHLTLQVQSHLEMPGILVQLGHIQRT